MQKQDSEFNFIPTAWEDYDCEDHPIFIVDGESGSGDRVSDGHQISYCTTVIPA